MLHVEQGSVGLGLSFDFTVRIQSFKWKGLLSGGCAPKRKRISLRSIIIFCNIFTESPKKTGKKGLETLSCHVVHCAALRQVADTYQETEAHILRTNKQVTTVRYRFFTVKIQLKNLPTVCDT